MTEEDTINTLRKWSFNEVFAELYKPNTVHKPSFFDEKGWTAVEFFFVKQSRDTLPPVL